MVYRFMTVINIYISMIVLYNDQLHNTDINSSIIDMLNVTTILNSFYIHDQFTLLHVSYIVLHLLLNIDFHYF